MISNKNKLAKVAQQMNFRHRMARLASRSSSDYHTYLFFKNKNATDSSIITSISKESITLLLPKYGFEV